MLPLLSVLAITASPVFVQSVQGQAKSGQYELHIVGERPIDPGSVSGRIEGRRFTVYVDGGRARSDNRAWGQGESHVKAYRHKERLELEARLPAVACKSGVNVAAAANGGVIASVNCPALLASKPDTKPTQAAVAKQSATKAAAIPEDSLMAAVALPAAEAPVDVAPPQASATLPAATPNVPELLAVVPPTKSVVPPAPSATPASVWSVAFKALTPVAILAGLALVGLKFARKRRSHGRHVRIIETTPLGPKRSLIVAQVGNETLLLGASEAGISLIQVRPNDVVADEPMDDLGPSITVETAAPEKFWVDSYNDVPASKDEAAEAGQVKLLSRLFRKRRQDIPEAWPFANILDASMLEEPREDRELREKLAMGMEARIP